MSAVSSRRKFRRVRRPQCIQDLALCRFVKHLGACCPEDVDDDATGVWHHPHSTQPNNTDKTLRYIESMAMAGDLRARCDLPKPSFPVSSFFERSFDPAAPPDTTFLNSAFSTRVLPQPPACNDTDLHLDDFDIDLFLNDLDDDAASSSTSASHFSSYGTSRSLLSHQRQASTALKTAEMLNQRLIEMCNAHCIIDVAALIAGDSHNTVKACLHLVRQWLAAGDYGGSSSITHACASFKECLVTRHNALVNAATAYNRLRIEYENVLAERAAQPCFLTALNGDLLGEIFDRCRETACASLRQTCRMFRHHDRIVVPRPHFRRVVAIADATGKHAGPFPHARLKDGSAICGADHVWRVFIDFVRRQSWDMSYYAHGPTLAIKLQGKLIRQEHVEMTQSHPDRDQTMPLRLERRSHDERNKLAKEMADKYSQNPMAAAQSLDETPARPGENSSMRIYGALGPLEQRVPECRYLRISPRPYFLSVYYTLELVFADTKAVVPHNVYRGCIQPLFEFNDFCIDGQHRFTTPLFKHIWEDHVGSRRRGRGRDADKAQSLPAPAQAEFRVHALSSNFNNAAFQLKCVLYGLPVKSEEEFTRRAHPSEVHIPCAVEYSEPFRIYSKLTAAIRAANR